MVSYTQLTHPPLIFARITAKGGVSQLDIIMLIRSLLGSRIVQSKESKQLLLIKWWLGEKFGYATTLRSLSQGRAVYTMQFAHYEEVPKSKAEEIINANGGGR